MKDEKPEEGFSFNSAAAMIPHPDKVAYGLGSCQLDNEIVYPSFISALLTLSFESILVSNFELSCGQVKTGGEDAYFIEGTRWVGVADGVGGWALSGECGFCFFLIELSQGASFYWLIFK